ncbi:tRNA (adenine(22)-N(1))-methyltransferase TrmK [Carnobacteriaceae bacterium zg-ZUI252]|nr:tRNA (adenine(22)-N(1))-methyltransferase TrmK [Carnobacteriaceae bacterium zg-ZUI252]MBS4770341.1 tRNA (adenine(22)-N(1))-methyltransferase TrmK [Carnobacteriaceae bacterium zg-ZUI240]
MNHEHLSKRLQTVAQFVPQNARLADIGSDHAYLPCHLVLQGRISYALAGEVVKGPFELAQKHVAQLNLGHLITARMADGLMAVEKEDAIDTVTICGMGGDLIASILEKGKQNGKLDGVTTLITQPNVDEQHVRLWLMENHYRITDEIILEENGKIYEIIVAEFTTDKVVYTQEELTFGVFLPAQKSDVFVQKWIREIEKYDKIILSLQKANSDTRDKIDAFKAEQQRIKEIIK